MSNKKTRQKKNQQKLDQYLQKLNQTTELLNKYKGRNDLEKLKSFVASFDSNDLYDQSKLLAELNKIINDGYWRIKVDAIKPNICDVISDSEFGDINIASNINIYEALFIATVKNNIMGFLYLLNKMAKGYNIINNDPNYTFRFAEGMDSCYELLNNVMRTGEICIIPNNENMKQCFEGILRLRKMAGLKEKEIFHNGKFD